MTRFETLKRFITTEMKMSQIYQPLMLIELLKNMDGKASVKDIAQSILNKDPTQIDYFSQIVKNMVGRVLTSKQNLVTKEKDVYSLVGSEDLSNTEAEQLIELCEQKIAEFEAKRGDAAWNHRKRWHRPISGSIRYQVLAAAKGSVNFVVSLMKRRCLKLITSCPRVLVAKMT